ncbi:hypothetical protein BDD12DRAFT_259139 [Trichophaea hybrida]|nr:hypothetical protein BDD12DRAFT_259139 [Trichophaea hybrida]
MKCGELQLLLSLVVWERGCQVACVGGLKFGWAQQQRLPGSLGPATDEQRPAHVGSSDHAAVAAVAARRGQLRCCSYKGLENIAGSLLHHWTVTYASPYWPAHIARENCQCRDVTVCRNVLLMC